MIMAVYGTAAVVMFVMASDVDLVTTDEVYEDGKNELTTRFLSNHLLPSPLLRRLSLP